ncbi:MAG: glycosyltransferase [Butyrivibrio sp.]|nr:glycosyltransferase [Butyrivibrio sp.]
MEVHQILNEEKTKLVSVIIPAYNAGEYIGVCLENVVSQTYQNLEIIIIDDGSGDCTCRVCEEFAGRDSRIRLLKGEHRGVSAARNLGLESAGGDYVIFVDADDYPEKDLVESYVKAYDFWKEKDVALAVCGMYMDNYVNRHVGSRKRILEAEHGYVEGEEYLISKASAALLAWLRLFNFVTNKCYVLGIIKDNKICFDESVHIGEDLTFNLDYLDNSHGYLGVINRPLYHYIKRTDGSLSISYHEGDLEDTKAIYDRFVEWEMSQEGATYDNILIVKAIYVMDWTIRLKDIFINERKNKGLCKVKKQVNEEIRSRKYRQLLTEIYQGKKISKIRYLCLRSGRFELFYFFRGIYQWLKG